LQGVVTRLEVFRMECSSSPINGGLDHLLYPVRVKGSSSIPLWLLDYITKGRVVWLSPRVPPRTRGPVAA
jgi:hypothetical protein